MRARYSVHTTNSVDVPVDCCGGAVPARRRRKVLRRAARCGALERAPCALVVRRGRAAARREPGTPARPRSSLPLPHRVEPLRGCTQHTHTHTRTHTHGAASHTLRSLVGQTHRGYPTRRRPLVTVCVASTPDAALRRDASTRRRGVEPRRDAVAWSLDATPWHGASPWTCTRVGHGQLPLDRDEQQRSRRLDHCTPRPHAARPRHRSVGRANAPTGRTYRCCTAPFRVLRAACGTSTRPAQGVAHCRRRRCAVVSSSRSSDAALVSWVCVGRAPCERRRTRRECDCSGGRCWRTQPTLPRRRRARTATLCALAIRDGCRLRAYRAPGGFGRRDARPAPWHAPARSPPWRPPRRRTRVACRVPALRTCTCTCTCVRTSPRIACSSRGHRSAGARTRRRLTPDLCAGFREQARVETVCVTRDASASATLRMSDRHPASTHSASTHRVLVLVRCRGLLLPTVSAHDPAKGARACRAWARHSGRRGAAACWDIVPHLWLWAPSVVRGDASARSAERAAFGGRPAGMWRQRTSCRAHMRRARSDGPPHSACTLWHPSRRRPCFCPRPWRRAAHGAAVCLGALLRRVGARPRCDGPTSPCVSTRSRHSRQRDSSLAFPIRHATAVRTLLPARGLRFPAARGSVAVVCCVESQTRAHVCALPSNPHVRRLCASQGQGARMHAIPPARRVVCCVPRLPDARCAVRVPTRKREGERAIELAPTTVCGDEIGER